MATQSEVTEASPADIAADMGHHRRTYLRFINLLKYSAAAIAVVLFILFLAY